MFRQMKVDIIGVVENMSYFVCPHCQHEIDVFSPAARKKLRASLMSDFLGSIQLDPEIRKASDSGNPTVAQGESSSPCKSSL